MTNTKIKPELNGVAETMLLTFYARAQYSRSPKHAFYDAKAVELAERLDYDFSKASRDVAMGSGTIARTIVFDELVQTFLQKHPDATVVNIACGLDTRVYRMDTGKCTWYNLDLPETIRVRDQIFQEQGRISTVGKSVLDPTWHEDITQRGTMLFVIEGLSMYLQPEEVAQMLRIIHDNFDNAYVMMETTSPFWVRKQSIEKSVQGTGAIFTWGVNRFSEMQDLAQRERRQYPPRHGEAVPRLPADLMAAGGEEHGRENSDLSKGLRQYYFHTSPTFSTALSTTCGKQKPWFFVCPFEFMTNIAQFTGIRHQHPVQNSPDRNRFVTGFPLYCGKLC